ncbi:MAG: glycoside hydrolase family 66 protein [Clostridia bacterium]
MQLTTTKGTYNCNDPITLCLSLNGDELGYEIALIVTHLEQTIYTTSLCAEQQEVSVVLPPLGKQGMGLGVEASIQLEDGRLFRCQTAVPIGGGIVRYGFLSDFMPEDDEDLCCMAAWHLSHVQFYDWSYRHDTLVSPTDDFYDMMGKRNSFTVIRQKISACHERGMLAQAYGAVYAASKAFHAQHMAWGLYASLEKPLVFIDTFYFMNIASPWREHLFTQYRSAMEQVGFDGIHMDTYGYPKRALDTNGNTHNLQTELPALIVDADRFLRTSGLTPHLIFNNVGTWPVQSTQHAPQEAVYMEIWPPYDRLRHLRQAAMLAKSAGKPIVLAAYLAPFRTQTEAEALYCALISSFAIALSGATQLLFGEKNAVLTQGYYADYTLLTPWQAERLHAYQDFFVRYQELFFDQSLQDVSMTHSGWDNMEYRCDTPYSVEGEPDKLWLTFLENDHRRAVGLLNLCGNADDRWNEGKAAPTPIHAIVLRILLLKPIHHAFYASPDEALGAVQMLPCECLETDRGVEAVFTIPKLFVSGLLWFDVEASA